MSSRLLPALAVAFAAGIVVADRLVPSHATCWLGAGALLGGAGALRSPRLRAGLVLAATALTGAAALVARLEPAARSPGARLEATVEATIAARVLREDGFELELAEVAALESAAAVPGRILLRGRLDPRFPPALGPPEVGERWRLRVRLRPPAGLRNPGAPDRARALARRGIAAVATLAHPGLAVRVGERGEGPARWLRGWRRRTAERVAEAGPGGPLLAALGLGERRRLDPVTRDAFARLGLAHLLAVSGLHLSLAASGAYLLARVLLVRAGRFAARRDARRAALGVAVVAACAHALASGFAIPVQRALVLVLAAALALAQSRARRRSHPLALAGLVVLARAPQALFEPGFQLSFCATAALLLAGPGAPAEPLAGWQRRLARLAAGLLRTSAAALLATTPLVAAHFGRVEPVGLVANLLAIPVTAGALLPAAAVAVAAASLEGGAAAGTLRACERIAAAASAAVAAAAAGLGPGVVVAPPPPWALAASAALAAAALRRGRLCAMAIALAAQVLLLVAAPPPAIGPAPPRVVFLDVGQGDATLVQGRQGVLLIDAGPRAPSGFDAGRHAVVPALRALGVRRIDRVAASHADLDHRGGLPAVVEALPVGALWLPRGSAREPGFAALRAAARSRGTPVLERGAGDADERVGDLHVAFAGPPHGDAGRSRNDGSLVLRVRLAGRALLLAGDVGSGAERALLSRGARLDADLLLLPHHGSRTSSSAALLDAVAPRHAIASAPCLGRFAMPHDDVRRRLAERGIALHWTGRDGAVVVGLAPRLRVRHWGTPHAACDGPVRVGKNPPDRLSPAGESR